MEYVNSANKKTCGVRREHTTMGLRVTVESSLVITDFLDVKLILNDLSYMPYKKLNAKIMYVNENSSLPKTVLKQIPNIINRRSSKKEKLLEIKTEYELIIKKNPDMMINLNM